MKTKGKKMKSNKEDSRHKLTALLNCREVMNEEIRKATHEYLEEYNGESIIFISDHAIIRHIERVLNQEVPESHLGDKDRVVKYLTKHNLNGEKFRNSILTLEEQKIIARGDVKCFHKNGFRYFIKSLALVSIVPNRDKREK